MADSGQALIKLDGVTKVFFTDEVETHALSGIHLQIDKGEYVSIAGPSGCGKSTLLSILGLLDSPTEGQYLLNNRPVAELPASERARVRNREIGFIFQSFNLIGDLTVFENVELPLTYRGMRTAERKQRVEAALERVGMAHRAKHVPSQLSGGQQQRVAVARAVAGEPLILLADEPTGNLDSKSGEQVMDLLKEVHDNGATICIVTHDPRYARHAERSINLFDGKIVDSPFEYVEGPGARLRARPLDVFKRGVDDLSVEEVDAPFSVARVTRIVRDDADGRAVVVNLLQEIHDLLATLRIEVTGRFVRKQDQGLTGDSSCDRDSLLLAA